MKNVKRREEKEEAGIKISWSRMCAMNACVLLYVCVLL